MAIYTAAGSLLCRRIPKKQNNGSNNNYWNGKKICNVKYLGLRREPAEQVHAKSRSYQLFSSYQLNAQFLYSITIYLLHYNPLHVSSSTLLIFRRTNCFITASGIVTLCKRPYSMPVESGQEDKLFYYSLWYRHSL